MIAVEVAQRREQRGAADLFLQRAEVEIADAVAPVGHDLPAVVAQRNALQGELVVTTGFELLRKKRVEMNRLSKAWDKRLRQTKQVK